MMDDQFAGYGFDRAGNIEVRKSACEALADKLDLATTTDLWVGVNGLLKEARSGHLNDSLITSQLPDSCGSQPLVLSLFHQELMVGSGSELG